MPLHWYVAWFWGGFAFGVATTFIAAMLLIVIELERRRRLRARGPHLIERTAPYTLADPRHFR